MPYHRGDRSKGGMRMTPDFYGLHCTNCYYACDRYNRNGSKIGVECAKDNMRFIDIETASVMCCGAYAERDCDE